VNAPGHGTQPSSPCPNCKRSNTWFQPDCRHCGLNLWTNTFEPLDEYFARRFGSKKDTDD
jgi:hypothetical protein